VGFWKVCDDISRGLFGDLDRLGLLYVCELLVGVLGGAGFGKERGVFGGGVVVGHVVDGVFESLVRVGWAKARSGQRSMREGPSGWLLN